MEEQRMWLTRILHLLHNISIFSISILYTLHCTQCPCLSSLVPVVTTERVAEVSECAPASRYRCCPAFSPQMGGIAGPVSWVELIQSTQVQLTPPLTCVPEK